MEEKLRILVAEDNELQLKIFCEALSKAGFDVVAAGYGSGVYRKVVETRPHLVLLDIMMPEIDGIEMCRNLKRAPVTKDTLIAIHSSKREPEFMDMTYEMGADAYIIKSDNSEELISRIKELIREKLGREI